MYFCFTQIVLFWHVMIVPRHHLIHQNATNVSIIAGVAQEIAAIDGILDNPRCKKNDTVQELKYTRDTPRE